MSKFVIKPMKHHNSMDKSQAAEVWRCLARAIDEIYNRNASSLSFEELYRFGYNLCMTKHGSYLYSQVAAIIRSHLIETQTKLVKMLNNESLLIAVCESWSDHKLSTGLIKDVLMYMDNTFVKHQNLAPVFTLGLQLFRDEVIYHPEIRARLQEELLASIAAERRGELIDHSQLRAVLSMLSELSVCGAQVYEEEFETPFLSTTKDHFQQLSLLYLSTHSVPDYLKLAEERLEEEAQRVTAYLAQSSEPKLRSLVETELLATHVKTLLESDKLGAKQLFAENNFNDLRRMYALLSRIPLCLDLLRESMGQFIRLEGERILLDQSKNADPILFMQLIFDLKAKFDTIIASCFQSDKKFTRRLKEALEDFINKDARCAGYLATYVDNALKSSSGQMEEGQESMDRTFDKVMIIFRYLNDKVMEHNSLLIKSGTNHSYMTTGYLRELLSAVFG